MAFDPHQLDEIRAALKISDVVGSSMKLRKQGNEFVAVDDQSLTVNDAKGIYYDFGKGNGGGDIFQWMQEREGLTFPEAVEELAKRAGISLKDGARRASAAPGRHGNAQASDPRDNDRGDPGPAASGNDRPNDGVASSAAGRNEVVTEWDYRDVENNLLYQVVRVQQRMPDGSWRKTREGKTWKTFWQRRPDGAGSWILGLDVLDRETGEPLEFIKTERGQAWLRATEDRLQWKGITKATFGHLGNVEHWLYNANAIVDELQEPKEDQRIIFLPEGEAKVDVLKEWGLLAVTNSGGAKHFTETCAEFLRGARQVVILQDNDRAGTERVEKLAPMLKAVGVELVQALNFRDVWPACPPKGDVKDWRDQGKGTKDQLLEIVDGLKTWSPAPYVSKFGAMTARDLATTAVRAYPWRIKGILPMFDNALVMGPSRSGKTFEVLDMVFHVHDGEPFAGRKVVPGGYVYLTYEGATGFENRLRAYLKHHGKTAADLHSFAWLTRPPNLFASEDNVVALATEIVEIAKAFKLPLAGIIVDTHNSATRGSSEIKSDDMNKIMSNYDVIREKTGAPLLIIGHTNAEGRHRGNEQFFNNIETAILIERVYTDSKHTIERRDDDGATVRRGRIVKQREGDDRTQWDFVLKSVEIGKDEDGEPITSMVSIEPAQHVPESVVQESTNQGRPEGFYLKGNNVDVFRALLKAIEAVGKPAPASLGLPASVGHVITWAQLGIEYKKTDPQEEGESLEKYRNRLKARTRRFREDLLKYNIIGIAEMTLPPVDDGDGVEKPKPIWYVWPTGRRVYGKGLQWPPVAKKKEPAKPLLAPGENDSLEGFF